MTLQLTGNSATGSPLLSLNAGTSARFCWGPYGSSAPRSGTAASLPGFNGERQDPFSGVSHLGNGYRAYSPALHRFTCPDSESPFGIGGINPYAYCSGDPVNLTDPSGHGPLTLLLRVIARIAIRAGIKETIADGLITIASATMKVETGVAVACFAATGVASAVEAGKGNKDAAKSLGFAALGQGLCMAASFGLSYALPKIFGPLKKIVRGVNDVGDPQDFRRTAHSLGINTTNGNTSTPNLGPGESIESFSFWKSEVNAAQEDLIISHGTLFQEIPLLATNTVNGFPGEIAWGVDNIIEKFSEMGIDLRASTKPLHIFSCGTAGFSETVATMGDELAVKLGRTIYTYGVAGMKVTLSPEDKLFYLHAKPEEWVPIENRAYHQPSDSDRRYAIKRNTHKPEEALNRLIPLMYPQGSSTL